MKDVNWNSYHLEGLKFIFSESSKRMDESIKSFRENSNKGFIAMAVYTGIVSASFKTLATDGINITTLHHLIFCLGSAISIWYLRHCIYPQKINLPGTDPGKLVSPFFEKMDDATQNRELLITKIIDNQKAISENMDQIKKRTDGFNASIKAFLYSVALGGIVGIFTVCNNRIVCSWPFN